MTLTNGILAPYDATSKRNRTSASVSNGRPTMRGSAWLPRTSTWRCSDDGLAVAQGSCRPELTARQESRVDVAGDDAVRGGDRCVDRECRVAFDRRGVALLA